MLGLGKYTLVFTLVIVVCVFSLQTADGMKEHIDKQEAQVNFFVYYFSGICTQTPQRYVGLLQTFNI